MHINEIELKRQVNDLFKDAAGQTNEPKAELSDLPPFANDDERSDYLQKLEKRLFRQVGRAIGDFELTEDGDRVLVAVSGGKDSWVMLQILNEMRKRAPIKYDIVAVNIDQGYAGFRQDTIEDYLAEHKIPFHMEYVNIAKAVEEKSDQGDIACSLCARLRRGSLYGLAEKLGCNKIALGHHQDDLIETLLLNVFFVGKIASMAPKLRSDDEKHVVIRPLIYASEKDIAQYAKLKEFPVICCQCPLMCGEATHADAKRRMVKNLISLLEKQIPFIKNSLLGALGNVHTTHLLDRELFDFSTISKDSFKNEVDAVVAKHLPHLQMGTTFSQGPVL